MAITLLDAALTRVADEQKAFGKSAEFELLRPFLTVGSQTVSYRDIARELENGQIKIADFGIAKLIQSQKSQPALTQERQVILM